MRKLWLILGGTVAGIVLLVAGIALGDALTDDGDSDTAATATAPASTPVAAATPVVIDPEATPEEAFAVDPDAEIPAPEWPQASPIELTGTAEDIEAATGDDSDAALDPWVPPTSPAFDPETGEVDPEGAPTREDDVDVLDGDEVAASFESEPELDLLFRFVDGCAGEADGAEADEEESDEATEGACPEGVGGTIVLTGGGEPPAPLLILRGLYTWAAVPTELRCSSPGFTADGTYRAVLSTNNPGDFTMRYWPTGRGEDGEIEFSTSDEERDIWAEKRISGESTDASLPTGVHHCLEIPGIEPDRNYVFEVHGVDDAGTEADTRFTQVSTTRVGAPLTRPVASFTPVGSSGNGKITVPYDERTEQVYLATLARAGTSATTDSCSTVENSVFDGTRRGNRALGVRAVTAFPRSEDDGFIAGIESALVVDFIGEEGTRYDICVWVTRPPTRSFDKPPVVSRKVISVRTPVRWRTRILLGGGHANRPLPAESVSVRAVGWTSPIRGVWPPEPVDEGAFFLDEAVVLQDGESAPVTPFTVLEVTGPGGHRSTAMLPTPTECVLFMACDLDRTRMFDVNIPGPRAGSGMCGGFGPCDPPTTQHVAGNLRLVVENYAGPSGPPTGPAEDSWQVIEPASFDPGGAPELPTIPRIDHNSVRFQPYGGTGVGLGSPPGADVSLTFDRPVTVTVVPELIGGPPCSTAAVPQRRDTPNTQFVMRFEGLCRGATYGLGIVATDADGNVLDLRTIIDGVSTHRYPSFTAEMPGVDLGWYEVRVTVDQIGANYGVHRLRVGETPVVRRGAPRCFADDPGPDTFTVRNHDGYIPVVADPWVWELVVQPGPVGNCASPESSYEIRLSVPVPLEDLADDGRATVHFTDDEGTDVTVEISGVEFI